MSEKKNEQLDEKHAFSIRLKDLKIQTKIVPTLNHLLKQCKQRKYENIQIPKMCIMKETR